MPSAEYTSVASELLGFSISSKEGIFPKAPTAASTSIKKKRVMLPSTQYQKYFINGIAFLFFDMKVKDQLPLERCVQIT